VKKILFILLLVLAAYLIWRWWNSDGRSTAADEGRGKEIMFDRMWIDHMPRGETDTVQIFAAVTEQPFGVFQSSSSWRGAWELFMYDDKGDGKIVLQYGQTRESERASYRAARCDEKGFEFCLELSGNSRGVKRYYSRKGWEIGGAGGMAALRAREAELLGQRALP
jgi:hypothetical protein